MDKKKFDQLIKQVSEPKKQKKPSSHQLYARGWDRIFGQPIAAVIKEVAPLSIKEID